MRLFTIGFTKKSAQRFFETLRESGARRIVDVRLNNVSQLAGFAKKDDLAYFAKAICGMDYAHLPELAPTQEILEEYRKQGGDWKTWEKQILSLMKNRRIEETGLRPPTETKELGTGQLLLVLKPKLSLGILNLTDGG